MTRKLWLWIAMAVVLAGISLYLNRDWFAKDDIQIYHRSRPARAGLVRRKNPAVDSLTDPIVFGFDRKVKLKSLKVIPLSDIQTHKFPRPIWHLVSDSNSVPVKDFTYGAQIRGMHAAIPGSTADTLEPGVTYRLSVEADSFRKEHDFVPVARRP